MIRFALNNSNKYSLIYISISLIISILQYFYALWVSWYGTLTSWLFVFIPSAIVILICLIGNKTQDKHPKTIKVTVTLINTIIISIIQLIFCSLFTLLFAGLFEREVINIKDYKHAITSIGWQERISHFPNKIPENSKNITLRKEANNWFGSEEIHLSFDTNPEYIKRELSKYNFQKEEGPFEHINNYDYYFRSLDPNNLKKTNYKVYYIKIHHEAHNNFANGIAVRNNRIMYFYNFPD